MDDSSVIFQGTFEGTKTICKNRGIVLDGCKPILEEKHMKIHIVLFRKRHERYGLDEWTVLRIENGEVIKGDTWGSASMALRYFADRARLLSDEYKTDYYEGKFLPALDEIFDLQLTKKLD